MTLLLAAIAPAAIAFVTPFAPGWHQVTSSSAIKMSSEPFNRRTMVGKSLAALVGGAAVVTGAGKDLDGVFGVETSASAAGVGSEDSPVGVVGASGKTGKLAVQGLLRRGEAVRAVTRTGDFPLTQLADGGGVLSTSPGDVTKIDTLKTALAGCGAVLFCASASKKGGNAEAVDYRGVINTAQACVDLGVPRLVIISSGAVTKPDSIGYKVTNIFGNIMTLKRKGELGVEEIYANAPKGVTYTIVRPGGLTDGAPVGPKGIELNQGDTIGGTVNRADVAEVLVEAALSPATENVVFEVYDKSTGNPLQGGFAKPSGFEHSGSSYSAMFQGLQQDIGL